LTTWDIARLLAVAECTFGHHRLDPALAALGRVVEEDAVAVDPDVPLVHRRQAVGLVRDRVVLGADAEEAAVQQAGRDRQDVLPREVVALEVRLDTLAQRGQRPRELDHVLELLAIARGAPLRVVEVLLAAALVDARGLDVSAGVRADPHVLPRRRDDELVDPGQELLLVDAITLLVDVGEPASAAHAPDAGAVAERASQPCRLPGRECGGGHLRAVPAGTAR
jgi:hypothetical protein